jgi:predicted metal-dependent hydrolase
LPFLGETAVVVLDPHVGSVPGGALLDASDAAPSGDRRHALRIGLPLSATPVQIRAAVQSWLQRQARRVFEERCRLYAGRLGVRMTRLALSSAQTRWGSANASGAIRLNWRLIHFALPTIDYVVAHELAHLREMNHSPRFWDVVRSVLPDYEQARGALKHDALPVFE